MEEIENGKSLGYLPIIMFAFDENTINQVNNTKIFFIAKHTCKAEEVLDLEEIDLAEERYTKKPIDGTIMVSGAKYFQYDQRSAKLKKVDATTIKSMFVL